MKNIYKIIFVLILIFLVQSSYANSSEDIQKNVFKLESYYFDEFYNTFLVNSYWSATLIDENKILTNAHVILDNWEINWKYSLCQTYDFKKEPKCFSKLKVISYDEEKDLALLQILDNKGSLWEPLKLTELDLNIWDSVITYWYPWNWWDTITFTQWKISWFDHPYYKIDANLDGWASWWAVFDEENNFIWVPSAVSYWDTTLWEFIPYSSVKTFLDNASETKAITNFYSFIWEEENKEETEKQKEEFVNFNKFIDEKHTKYLQDYVDTWFIRINNLRKYWFRISNILTFEYWSKNQSSQYELKSDLDNTKIFVNHFLTMWDVNYTNKDKKDLSKMMKDKEKDKNKKEIFKKVKIKWEEVDLSIRIDLKTKDISFAFENWNWIYIEIDWSLKYKKELNKSLILVLKEFERTNDIKEELDEISINWLHLKKTDWFNFAKFYNNKLDQLQFIWMSKWYESNVEWYDKEYMIGTIDVLYYEEEVDFSEISMKLLKDVMEEDNFLMPGLEKPKVEILYNWWRDYLYMNWKMEGSKFNLHGFITYSKHDDIQRYYVITFLTLWEKNKQAEKYIQSVIENIEVDWEDYLKETDLKYKKKLRSYKF